MPNLLGKSATLRQGVVTPPNFGSAALTLSGYGFNNSAGAVLTETLENHYYLFIIGQVGTAEQNGFAGALSGYSFEARCGGGAALDVSLPTFAAAGTSEQTGQATPRLSGYAFSATGTTDAAGGVSQTYTGDYSLRALAGANAAGTLPRLRGTSGGTADERGQAEGVLPRPTLVAHGYGDNLGQVVGVLPTLSVGSGGRIVATLPRAMFVATGGSQSVVYEAYSIMLEDGREGMEAYTTHYTNYPFDRILRFNGKYYGVAADGLFELNGNTFNGAAIISVVQTAPTDFKERTLKRPVSMYLSGRASADFKVSVNSAETDTNRYTYKPVLKTGARTHRVLFGKGVRARYISYTLTNTDGGDFELDDMTPEIVVMERRTA